jgi:hypothetical protein
MNAKTKETWDKARKDLEFQELINAAELRYNPDSKWQFPKGWFVSDIEKIMVATAYFGYLVGRGKI